MSVALRRDASDASDAPMQPLAERIQFTPTGVILPDGLAFEDWASYGATLFAMERGVMWAIGDWWIYGDHRYGERASAVLDSRYSYQTFKDAGWVARAIERSRRRDLLTFSHHKEVAPLPPEEQEFWLAEAEQGQWTCAQLRSHIKRGTTEDEPIADKEPWAALTATLDTIDALLERDTTAIAASVPGRRRAATARKLRKLGVGLGRIAWTLEGLGDEDDQRIPAA